MAGVKDIDINEKEKDLKESPSQSNTNDTDAEGDVLRAAGIDLTQDDNTENILTLRMWVLAIGFCIVASGLNTLYTLRQPSLTISANAVLLLAYPLGKLWEKAVPAWDVPLRAWSFSLNPGHFSTKEHTLIYVMSNLSIYVRLGADVLVEQEKFYGYNAGWGFQILITLSTLLIGFNTWKISRYAFFSIVCAGSFCWYWFPDFIFPALSYFNFPCWIKPHNTVVNQVFGMSSGMGLIPITFDWSQISYVGSPLLVPLWAILNVFGSLVFWIWIVAVACYYTNVWNTGYLPFQSSNVFDNTGATYKVSKIVNAASNYTLDVAKYLAYSPVYMPITYAMNMVGLSFATLTALLVWVALNHRDVMVDAARRIPNVVMESLPGRPKTVNDDETGAPEVPMWWYMISCLVALFMAIFAVEYWDVGIRWYGVLLALAIALVFFPPLALVYGTANTKINIDIFCRIVAGFVFEGSVLANIWFFDIGYITTIKGLWFAQDMKLAYYSHIPQRKLFLVQCVGMVIGTLSSLGVLNWALHHIEGVCTSAAPNGFTCPFSKTHFNTSLIWGAIGPRRYFQSEIGYSSLLYFFLIGAILPIPVYILSRRYPNSMWKRVHIPLFLGGLNFLPPATGMNYGSWAIVGLTFSWFIRKRLHAWWSKYNFVLSSALDSSVSVAGVLIFLTIFFTGASKHFKWWGTDVYKNTCDWKGCPHLTLSKGEKIGL
ncbi:hypothetical protein N7509_011535 [Penicillium cosmopolitanum]|uniref:Uncharacterized protein n=1 Tax=Penicillium cosmopolitanum TaxID=1131564 RepID=A0A9W9VGF0_9EURO|nr:uncharacterized protein N7509_011535 [Penicillium cosmopolitanum]KAJ5378416.1 hypothetical protein N7509_011535 [Penicillium cosmopolitanum]